METQTLQFKRGTAARWAELNPVLAAGEPGYEYGGKIKIGDGVTNWLDLPYVGANGVCSVNDFSELPVVGDANCLYKVGNERALYQWNTTDKKYEIFVDSFDPSRINIINGGNANG